jgi:hypothetical protein
VFFRYGQFFFCWMLNAGRVSGLAEAQSGLAGGDDEQGIRLARPGTGGYKCRYERR